MLFLKELERLKWQKQKDERMRQKIRENSTELRELEAKLRAGYMNKERAAQLAEKDTLKAIEDDREAEIAAMMQKEHDEALKREHQKEVARWEKSVEYQEQLERQLEEQVDLIRTSLQATDMLCYYIVDTYVCIYVYLFI